MSVRLAGIEPDGATHTAGVVVFSCHGRYVRVSGSDTYGRALDAEALDDAVRRHVLEAMFVEAKQLRTGICVSSMVNATPFPFGWDPSGAIVQAFGGTVLVDDAKTLFGAVRSASAMNLLSRWPQTDLDRGALLAVADRIVGRGPNPIVLPSRFALYSAVFGATDLQIDGDNLVIAAAVNDDILCIHRLVKPRSQWDVVFRFSKGVAVIRNYVQFESEALRDAVYNYMARFHTAAASGPSRPATAVATMATALGLAPGTLDRHGRPVSAATRKQRLREFNAMLKRTSNRTTTWRCYSAGRLTGDGVLRCTNPLGNCGVKFGDNDTPASVTLRNYRDARALGFDHPASLAAAKPPCSRDQRTHRALLELDSIARYVHLNL